MEGDAIGLSIDKSIDLVGKTVEVALERVGGELNFKGIITTVHIDRTYTGDNLIVFGGYSPTYMLEDGAGTKSFEEKDIKSIVNEILGKYSQNLLGSQIDPKYTFT